MVRRRRAVALLGEGPRADADLRIALTRGTTNVRLSILYRGPLASCNYGCEYCPFAKRKDSREALATDLAAGKKKYHLAKGAGHYGIFNGRKWREKIAPVVERFIADHD